MRETKAHQPIPKPDSEGYITWHTSQFPDVKVETWYRVNGSLDDARACVKGKEPVLLLHGGPGATHSYLLTLLELLDMGRTIIMYDQIGCGKSTLLDERQYDSLWVRETFVEELEVVFKELGLKKAVILGQSWGGDLAMLYTAAHPDKVTCLITSSGVNDGKDAADACRSRIAELPAEHQMAIYHAEAIGDFESKEYKAAGKEFADRFIVEYDTAPEEARATVDALDTDQHVYRKMWGPSEFSADGNLLKVHIENVDRITCPTLVIYGSEDEIAANQPNIYKSLTGVKKKELFVVQGGKHMTWLDDPETYFGAIRSFVKRHA